ncbi:SDR family oxidoreductase [Weissella confusa]|uniref:SDR family oxidoreductase n=1 Tax=Weissella confusa TaxID=1583 RepID=UPI0005E4EE60|nr:aldehyde reductase [Weissella confusa]COI40557.1 reductase [Streptococcus pneumoniae]
MQNERELVLVTGGSGYIAVNIILQLLEKGYAVRATLRNMTRQNEVKTMLRNGGLSNFSDLTFVRTDLSSDEGWTAAMKNVTYVMHVASPTPATTMQTKDEIIQPAVDGVLRVYRAAKLAGVKRIVLTSAFGAVGMGTTKSGPYTEEDWTDITNTEHPYQISKTAAERAAWQFIAEHGGDMEMTAINPVGVMGPILGKDFSHSNQTVRQMLSGEMRRVPKLSSGYVDVRDVATLHILAMENPAANGERFLATTGETLSMAEVAGILKKHFGVRANKVSTKEIPNWLLRLIAHLSSSSQLKMVATLLGKNMATTNRKAATLLGWHPRAAETAIVATAQGLIEQQIV